MFSLCVLCVVRNYFFGHLWQEGTPRTRQPCSTCQVIHRTRTNTYTATATRAPGRPNTGSAEHQDVHAPGRPNTRTTESTITTAQRKKRGGRRENENWKMEKCRKLKPPCTHCCGLPLLVSEINCLNSDLSHVCSMIVKVRTPSQLHPRDGDDDLNKH